MDDIKLALLGNKEAAQRLTDAGVLLPCSAGETQMLWHTAQDYCAHHGTMFIAFLAMTAK